MKIALGMSGGVDSSLSASVLREHGHEVTGVFLECWRAPGCRAEEDRKDALSVALQLSIPFQILDFKNRYKQRVVEYFFDEYKAGRTPNPDVMCNKEIKFGMFYDWAMEHGFDAVATGHYAQIVEHEGKKFLARSADAKKDQSYFLYVLREDQLDHIVFPIGHLQKSEVRKLAAECNLLVANKPDSQGICFIGEINVHNFLKERLGENPGEVVNSSGEVIGVHKGLWFYTIGQRHGFTLKGKVRNEHGEWKHVIPPFYVIGKNAEKNQLIVGFGEEASRSEFEVEQLHTIAARADLEHEISVRIRHGGQLFPANISKNLAHPDQLHVHLDQATRGIAEGQSAVFYQDNRCIGGSVIRG